MASFFPYFLIPFTLFLIFLYKWSSSTPRKRLPPAPPKLPIIGNLHQMGSYLHKSLQSLSKKYGPLMMVQLGSVPILVASSADTAREILKTQGAIFSNRPRTSIIDIMFYGGKDVTFATYGEYWRQGRAICVLKLLSNKKVQSYRHQREEETSMMIEKIKELGHSVINLSEFLDILAHDIFCRAALGRKCSSGEEGRKVKRLLADGGEVLGTPSIGNYISWLSWLNRVNGINAKAKRVAREMDEFLDGVVEEHRSRRNEEMMKNPDYKISDNEAAGWDFVDVLLQVQRESKDSPFPLENESIRAIILDVFSAGTDLTFSALEWMIADLLYYPRIMKKLQSEVTEIAADKEEITEDDLVKMPYLKAVVKESLRFHVLIPLLFPHESTADTKVMGYDVAAGTQIFINAYAIARDPAVWENPDDFIPERFLNSSMDFRGLHFEFIPFSAGRRVCPGISFAASVCELALAKLVHKFNFELPNGVGELDMTESTRLAARRVTPLLVVPIPRT